MCSKLQSFLKRNSRLKTRFKPSAKHLFIYTILGINSIALGSEETTINPTVLAPSLEVEPQRCVALHQGQVCYQSTNLVWHAPKTGHYCLYISNTTVSLQCWKGVQTGFFIHDFQSPHALTFRLRNMHTQQDLVQTQLNVAWVYANKKRQRSSWRLF
jgi:hypothetical protein